MTPLREFTGGGITRIGEAGGSQTAKVIYQVVIARSIKIAPEARVFAFKAGADPALLREAWLNSLAGSCVLKVHGERMIERSFNPGFRMSLDQQDPGQVHASARNFGSSLPNTAAAQELFNACEANGASDLDHSVMKRALEYLAGRRVAPDRAGP